jgi:Raf kinase inhibitor-like YbhB/YbcL family protein
MVMTLPLGDVSLARDIEVRFTSDPEQSRYRGLDVTWAPKGGGPYPTFSGTLTFESADERTNLALDGTYEPPGGMFGRAFNAVVGRRLADASVQALLQNIKADLEAEFFFLSVRERSQGVLPLVATSYKLCEPGTPQSLVPLTISSNDFANGGVMPLSAASAAAGGSDLSPNLDWSGAPAKTLSYAVTCFDPDAPTGVGFWHWSLVNIPARVTSLPAGASKHPPAGSVQGYTDYGTAGYGGPYPPGGNPPHRYIFTVYALDIPKVPGIAENSTGAFLMLSLSGHILANGTYVGLFSR